MTERSWQDELQHFLEDRLRAFASTLGQSPPPAGLRIGPPVSADEAKNFMRGVEEGLFAVDEQGQVYSSLIRVGKSDGTALGSFPIFAANPLRLHRRLVCVLSTAAALTLERGWLQPQIELASIKEPDNPSINPADIIITALDGHLLAAVVAKRTGYELEKLRNDLKQCGRRGPHSEANCGFPQNHATFEFCAENQPPYLWAVAPDWEICFQLTYPEDGTIALLEFHSLPPRSLLELLP